MSQQQRDHVVEYKRALAVWEAKNISEKNCHELAAATAKEKFSLEPDEQRAVDAWLDEKYPVRKKAEEKILYPLFDVPRVQ